MCIETLASDIAALLRLAVPGADFFPAEDGEPRELPLPLTRPACVVTLSRLESTSSALGDYLGVVAGQESDPFLYGRKADVTLTLALYAATEAACHTLFAAIAQALLFAESPCVREFSCTAPEYKLPREAWRLPAQARFSLLVTREEPAQSIHSFRLHANTRSD